MEYVKYKDKLNILRKGYCSVYELVKFINLNKEHPENHSLIVSNPKDNKMLVREDSRWQTENKDVCIDVLLGYRKDYILKEYEKRKDKLDKTTRKRFKKYYENCDKEEVDDNIKRDLIKLLYDLREIPLKTKRLLDKQEKQLENS